MTSGTPLVLSTRPEGKDDPLVAALREAGVRVLAVPTVAVEPLAFEPPDLAAYDWAVVTSATGAGHLLERVPPPPGSLRWAAVGPRTARALSEHGLRAAAVPEQSRGEAIAEAIAAVQPLPGLRVLLARADAAASDLPEALRNGGALVDQLDVYRTVEGPEASRASLNRALAEPGLSAVIFASGSAVRGLRRLAERDPRTVPAVTIGPATTRAAREEGFEVAAEATRPGVAEMVEALLGCIAKLR
ncbi:MAG: uroporphyrinogen-III synthase [Candidatus Dormibacteraeota bacterium]|nr:uroporphyrinogen-III synthase [Candidatus Dormibacteraeota bacterium]